MVVSFDDRFEVKIIDKQYEKQVKEVYLGNKCFLVVIEN